MCQVLRLVLCCFVSLIQQFYSLEVDFDSLMSCFIPIHKRLAAGGKSSWRWTDGRGRQNLVFMCSVLGLHHRKKAQCAFCEQSNKKSMISFFSLSPLKALNKYCRVTESNSFWMRGKLNHTYTVNQGLKPRLHSLVNVSNTHASERPSIKPVPLNTY